MPPRARAAGRTGGTAEMREQLRVGSRLSWIVAWLLALVGPLAYLLRPGDVTWWAGLLLLAPLVGLAVRRPGGDGSSGPGDAGPWVPPPPL